MRDAAMPRCRDAAMQERDVALAVAGIDGVDAELVPGGESWASRAA